VRGAELPHPVPALGSGVKARVWIRVSDSGRWDPPFGYLPEPGPRHSMSLAAFGSDSLNIYVCRLIMKRPSLFFP